MKEKARFLYKGRLSPPDSHYISYIKEDLPEISENQLEMAPPSKSLLDQTESKDEKNDRKPPQSSVKNVSTPKGNLEPPEGPKDPNLDQKPPNLTQKCKDEVSTSKSSWDYTVLCSVLHTSDGSGYCFKLRICPRMLHEIWDMCESILVIFMIEKKL